MTRDADALIHPVRLRVVQAVAAWGPQSAKELAARLGDVPHATLYRHVRALAVAGWLEVAAERQARGAVERTYRLGAADAVASAGDVAGAGRAAHSRWFAGFAAHLLGSFERYLAREPAPDPVAEGLSYRVATLHLSDPETEALRQELVAVVARYSDRSPGAHRRVRTVATVILPGGD